MYYIYIYYMVTNMVTMLIKHFSFLIEKHHLAERPVLFKALKIFFLAAGWWLDPSNVKNTPPETMV